MRISGKCSEPSVITFLVMKMFKPYIPTILPENPQIIIHDMNLMIEGVMLVSLSSTYIYSTHYFY